MTILKNIDTIVFDIGNVIVDIDYDTMVQEFKKIATADFSNIVGYHHQRHFFDHFEKGKLSEKEFRTALRPFLKSEVLDHEIDTAWNAILIGYPADKFKLLGELRKTHRVLALSNINEIHIKALDKYVQDIFGAENMRSYFHHAYYSNEIGYRKPEKEIYELLLKKENAEPARTLFIDDKVENTNAAAALGMKVHHLVERDSLGSLFRK